MPGVFRTSVVIVASLAGVLSNVVVNAQQPHDSLTAAAAGFCPPWVGRTVGYCNIGDPTVHKGSCYDHNNKQEYVQCIPPNIWDAYKCPSNIPDKCTYPDKYLAEGLDKLRTMLQTVMSIEQGVIPPYLSVFYSIRSGTNRNASQILLGVAQEEYMHMAAAAQVLNAVGGHPNIDKKNLSYPMHFPFLELDVGLTPFTLEQLSAARRIEEARWQMPDHPNNTIAVYYELIVTLMDVLVETYGEAAVFTGDPELQLDYNFSIGRIAPVRGHLDARKLLSGVLQQGCGDVPPLAYDKCPWTQRMQLPHYHRLNQIVKGHYYNTWDLFKLPHDPTGTKLDTNWSAIHDFLPNPKAADYKTHPDIYKKLMEFNACYTNMLEGLSGVFNGAPKAFGPQLQLMFGLGTLVKELVEIPAPGHPGKTVGPSWEWVNVTETQIPCPISMNILL